MNYMLHPVLLFRKSALFSSKIIVPFKFWLLHLPCLWQCNVHAQSVMVTCLVLSFLNILYHDR